MKSLVGALSTLALMLPAAALAAADQVTTLSASGWLPGPSASGLSTTFSGTVDQPSGAAITQVTGWVVDTTAQGWSGVDEIQLWNGLMNAGGEQVAEAVIQVDRPDVAAALGNSAWQASGYSANVTLSAFGPASTLYVYAHTPSRGWWFQEVLVTEPIGATAPGPRVDIEQPTPLGTVHSAQAFTIRGSAYDPAATPAQGIGVDRVQVYLNGDRKTGIYIGDAALGSFDKYSGAINPQFANAGWQLTFQPNSWMDIGSDNQLTQLTVYARSSVTGQEAQTQTTMVISVP